MATARRKSRSGKGNELSIMAWDSALVMARLEEAADTLDRLPATTPPGQRLRSAMPAWLRLANSDDVKRKPRPPEPAAIDRTDEAVMWLDFVVRREEQTLRVAAPAGSVAIKADPRALTVVARKVLWMQAAGIPTRKQQIAAGRYFGVVVPISDRTIRAWRSMALQQIVDALIAGKVPVRAAD
jgi:hypothetical protein